MAMELFASLVPASDDTASVEALSTSNRVFLIATIALFALLSAVSGREIWKHHYGRRNGGVLRNRAASPSATANTNGPLGALGPGALNKSHAYATPKHGYGGIPTPSTGALNSSGSANGVSVTTNLLEDESGASMSTGAEMRRRFFLLLFVASTIRVCSLIVEITTLTAMEASPVASLYGRLLALFLWIPSLLFVSMYGLVLLFWAQLCYACWGKAYPWPRRIFFLFNVLLYVAFVALLATTKTSGGFWRACDIMLGSVYVVGLGGILYYSIRLIRFFRNQGPDEEFFFDLPTSTLSPRQIVLRRITAVCVLLSLLFVGKAVYLLGMGTGFVPSEESRYRSPIGVHHIAFEFTMHFFTEFVPCALLIFFTRKQGNKPELMRSHSGNSTTQLPGTATSHSATPSYALRGHMLGGNQGMYQDDSVGSGSLTGYQYQAALRAYGITSAASSTTTNASSYRGPGNGNSLYAPDNTSSNTSGGGASYV
ncbi:hypothetical protein Poli38472_014301 [Pythium oligandrum]|uniref:THH1/TOM1/TOM3 domain-containing protein n=1 Tax=Pythium oligandrum TaxID=41045 RepID=A0A8K1C7J5_PYTOL|nr:hypothetical protein Poli38472_014301 [Pythium oligandrum]|eukprot:TMW57698.1 hypothetical protein Poli38472_014301 [Pythium oligandrum]